MPNLLNQTPKQLDLGLNKANTLSSGSGWMSAELTSSDDTALTVQTEMGIKLNQDWAAYGNIWAQPTVGEYGGVAGLRNSSFDLFVEGSGNTRGDHNVRSGIAWRF